MANMAAAGNLVRLLRPGGSLTWQDLPVKASVNPPHSGSPKQVKNNDKSSATVRQLSLAARAAAQWRHHAKVGAALFRQGDSAENDACDDEGGCSEDKAVALRTSSVDPWTLSLLDSDSDDDKVYCEAVGDSAVPTPAASDVAILLGALPASTPAAALHAAASDYNARTRHGAADSDGSRSSSGRSASRLSTRDSDRVRRGRRRTVNVPTSVQADATPQRDESSLPGTGPFSTLTFSSAVHHEQAFVESMVDLAWAASVGTVHVGRRDAPTTTTQSAKKEVGHEEDTGADVGCNDFAMPPEMQYNVGVQRLRAASRSGSDADSQQSRAVLLSALDAFEAAAAGGHVKAMVNAASIHMMAESHLHHQNHVSVNVSDCDDITGTEGCRGSCQPSTHRALMLLEEAAGRNNPRALGFLGAELLGRHKSKLPVDPNPTRARRLLRKASALGDEHATKLLRRLRRKQSQAQIPSNVVA
eukprot:m.164864 g.164864  ORF g.164864 m.164864 type:complete len:473 (-) comp12482_c0_seq1:136-1554(-)